MSDAESGLAMPSDSTAARSAGALSAADAAARWVLPAIGVYTLLLLVVTVFFHATPLYLVETDLLGEFIPAAKELAAGILVPDHLAYHGPGYPLVLAGLGPVCGGDYFLAARILSVLAMGAAAWLAWLSIGRIASRTVALIALAGLLVNPTFLRYAIEAGTDAPTLAVCLAATYGVLRAPSRSGLLLAGLAAGFATIMRYNAAFLIPAAALVLASRAGRGRGLGWYAAGALLPLGAWFLLNARLTGHALHNNNYLNIAYELYGRDLPHDRFEAEIGSRFHSLRDVLLFDPAAAGLRVLRNLGAHFANDLHDLVPLWLGVIAGPGLVLGFWRRTWRPAMIHVVLCVLTLAPVFYLSRFALYLLPFYLAGAAAVLVEVPDALDRRFARALDPAARRLRRAAIPAVTFLLLAASGVAAVLLLRANLALAPYETRLAGETLRREGIRVGGIMARKPHVAYFAGMPYVPMGLSTSLTDLMARAKAANAAYLFYSPIERLLRPEYAVLSDSGLSLPGLEQVAYRAWGPQRFYAVYRITAVPESAAMAAALERALVRYADRRRADPVAQLLTAVQLLEAGHYREAVDRLVPLERAGARDPAVSRMMSTAYLGLGDLEASYRACDLAMKLEPATAWHYARLAWIRQQQRRPAEAREWYRRAVEREPGNPRLLESLGLTCVSLREYAPAADAFDRCVRLEPDNARVRRYAMGAYQLAGDIGRAREILLGGVRAGIPLREMLDPDSTRTVSQR
jgi:tetratricopeptide (TPR) repeat protein